jgi:hypothetical protein
MKTTEATPRQPTAHDESRYFTRRHLKFGWWSLLVFLTLGIMLEAMHGLKIGWYLNVSTATRRLLWTLAHAHGTLLALVHIAFALTVAALPGWGGRVRSIASACLIAASILLPGGFFLGGIVIYSGDPGLGILLVPLGAVLLFVSVFFAAHGTKG